MSSSVPVTIWFQKTVTLKAKGRGCHLVTEELLGGASSELRAALDTVAIGIAHFFSTKCIHIFIDCY